LALPEKHASSSKRKRSRSFLPEEKHVSSSWRLKSFSFLSARVANDSGRRVQISESIADARVLLRNLTNFNQFNTLKVRK